MYVSSNRLYYPPPASHFVQFVYFEDKVMTSMIRKVWQFVKIAEFVSSAPSTGEEEKKMEDAYFVFFFSKSALLRYQHHHPIRFELDSNDSPGPLLDSCYYNLFHGTSNLIMGPIYYIFPKICSIYLFFYTLIWWIPLLLLVFSWSLFIYKQANFVPWWWFELFAPPPTCPTLLRNIVLFFLCIEKKSNVLYRSFYPFSIFI